MNSPLKARRYHSAFAWSFACIVGTAIAGGLAEARSMAELKQSGEVRICLVAVEDFTVEPKQCRENCKFGGDLYDMAMAFSQSLGVKARILRVEWDEQFFNKDGKTVREDSYTPELMASGKCDAYLTGLTRLPWRETKLAFVTLYPTRMVVVVNKSARAGFKTPADLCAKSAATVKDTSWHTWLQAHNETTCASNPIRIKLLGFEESSQAVDSGTADFTIVNFDNTLVLSNPYKNSVMAFPIASVVEQGWAFRKEDRDLQAAARKFLEGQKGTPDSLWNTQWRKAFGMTLPEYTKRVPQ